ncbi:DUF7402 domain-containing protein [Actinoplanes octamycinicus]|uniref:DUF7402 domain-containing protein n=1 Tax=Actinoplanes octamycinicus TaxID=135948 RepID=UPI003CD0B692
MPDLPHDGGAVSPQGATVGGKAGSWLPLTWGESHTVGRVVLYDRPNPSDRITGGRLTFSDGSVLDVPALPGDGSGLDLTFASAAGPDRSQCRSAELRGASQLSRLAAVRRVITRGSRRVIGGAGEWRSRTWCRSGRRP